MRRRQELIDYLRDITDAIEKAEQFTAQMNFE